VTAPTKADISTAMRSTCTLCALAALALCATMLPATSASGQTRSVRDTATAYGARLNARGQPANLNPARINSRLPSRLDSRLALRIERYRPNASDNPIDAFRTPTDDKSRSAATLPQTQPPVDIDAGK
jgi:hypothetical protein